MTYSGFAKCLSCGINIPIADVPTYTAAGACPFCKASPFAVSQPTAPVQEQEQEQDEQHRQPPQRQPRRKRWIAVKAAGNSSTY